MLERTLHRQTRGQFIPARRPSSHEAAELVSVVCPTSSKRSQFHPFIYRCFCQQAHMEKELVVIDAGDGEDDASDFFLVGPPASDRRVVYRYFDVADKQWSIGAKRNVACYLASGALIVHFDDDDIYAPEYLSWVLQAVRKGRGGDRIDVAVYVDQDVLCVQNGKVSPLTLHGFAAEAATLSYWHTFDLDTGTFRVCDPALEKPESRTAWLFGYGFSYAYLRSVWRARLFRDMNWGEDYSFMEWLLGQGGRVALIHDGAGICAHTHHGANCSKWERDEELRPEGLSGSLLPELGGKLQATLAPAADLLWLRSVELTLDQLISMMEQLTYGYAAPPFQLELHRVWRTLQHSTQKRAAQRRATCLKVAGPILLKYGFPNNWAGVTRSTHCTAQDLLEKTEIVLKGRLNTWLCDPDLQQSHQLEAFFAGMEGMTGFHGADFEGKAKIALQYIDLYLEAVGEKHRIDERCPDR